MKVLHLPSNVAGNAFGLAQGERALGLDSKALAFNSTKYNFPSDILIHTKNGLLSHLLNRLKIFFQVRQSYDVYHFNFGSSLLHYTKMGLNLADLPFYNKSALKIVTYQGCDARQKFPTIQRIQSKSNFSNAACLYGGCYDGICNSGKRDSERKNAIDKMMRYCEHAFALNPDLLHFLPKEKSSFLPYTVPNFNLIQSKSTPFFSTGKIRIIHAPTQRITKGSYFILEAIDKINSEYPGRIEFILIENMPYQKAIEIYRTADLVIDQLLIGWYGGLAVEVMKMGIPVMAYINEDDLEFVLPDMVAEMPIINANTENIYKKLKQIVVDRDFLIDCGDRSKLFVEKWHNPLFVAGITKSIYLRQLNTAK